MMLSNAKVILQGRHNTVRDSRMARACSWGHTDDLSTSSSAEVKNEWSYTYTTPVRLHGVDRDQSSTETRPVLRRMPCCDNAEWPL